MNIDGIILFGFILCGRRFLVSDSYSADFREDLRLCDLELPLGQIVQVDLFISFWFTLFKLFCNVFLHITCIFNSFVNDVCWWLYIFNCPDLSSYLSDIWTRLVVQMNDVVKLIRTDAIFMRTPGIILIQSYFLLMLWRLSFNLFNLENKHSRR